MEKAGLWRMRTAGISLPGAVASTSWMVFLCMLTARCQSRYTNSVPLCRERYHDRCLLSRNRELIPLSI
jgi:hypothetical protein